MQKTRVAKKVAKAKKLILLDKVKAAGKAGSSKLVIIQKYFSEELDWNKGDEIDIRRSSKNKIFVEKSVSK